MSPKICQGEIDYPFKASVTEFSILLTKHPAKWSNNFHRVKIKFCFFKWFVNFLWVHKLYVHGPRSRQLYEQVNDYCDYFHSTKTI